MPYRFLFVHPYSIHPDVELINLLFKNYFRQTVYQMRKIQARTRGQASNWIQWYYADRSVSEYNIFFSKKR